MNTGPGFNMAQVVCNEIYILQVYSMASASGLETEPFLSQVGKVRKEMETNFLRYHQILQQREAALMSELDQLVSSYKGDAIKEQIRDLNQMKETLKSSVQRNENQEIAMKSLELMENRIRELKIRLETVFDEMCGVELKWDAELEERLSELGEIDVITAQALEGKNCCIFLLGMVDISLLVSL